jgi:hypothetical protein
MGWDGCCGDVDISCEGAVDVDFAEEREERKVYNRWVATVIFVFAHSSLLYASRSGLSRTVRHNDSTYW